MIYNNSSNKNNQFYEVQKILASIYFNDISKKLLE